MKANIIGHFGLGFYSAFMVSEKVEVFTKSYQEDAPAVRWECDGSPEYTPGRRSKKPTRGTDIVLHINEESEEFLDAEPHPRLFLKNSAGFLPVPICFEGKQINNTTRPGQRNRVN